MTKTICYFILIKEGIYLGLAYNFMRSSWPSRQGAKQQAFRYGAGAVAESFHLIQKSEAEREGLGLTWALQTSKPYHP